MSKECTDRFDAGSRCRTGGRRMIRNRPDRTARGRISPRPGAATVRFAPQDTPPARIHSVRRTHTNEKPRRNSAGLLTDRSDIWRKRRDSNPRYPFEVYALSRRASSTTRAPLLGWAKIMIFPAIDQISLLLIHRPARYFPATVGKRRSRMLQNPGKRHSFPLAPAHSPSGKRPRAL